MSDGQFDWGGRLPKSNGGALRFPQHGWKSCAECKRIRELNCPSDIVFLPAEGEELEV